MKIEWNEETQRLAKWVQTVPTPTEAFQLNSFSRVQKPKLYFEKLREQALLGPKSPRARFGALQKELRELHSVITTRDAEKK